MCDLWIILLNLSQQLCLSLESPLQFLDFLVFFSLTVDPMKINYFYIAEMIWIFPAVLDMWWIMGTRSLFNVSQQKATTKKNKKKRKEEKKKKEKEKKEGENIFCLSNWCFPCNEENKWRMKLPHHMSILWGRGGRNQSGTTSQRQPKAFNCELVGNPCPDLFLGRNKWDFPPWGADGSRVFVLTISHVRARLCSNQG